jgi:uncharacterized protein YjbI with pentapeptide repeats
MAENRRKALVIAVSEYDQLDKLDFCKKDGYSITSLLKHIGYEIQDSLIGKVDGDNMRKKIVSFFYNDDMKSDDTILLYYSGHGIVSNVGEYFLSPTDIKSKTPAASGFSFTELTAAMEGSRSKRIVIVLDCCYAGTLKLGKGGETAKVAQIVNIQKERISELKEGVGKCLLSACSGYQEAFPTLQGDHSFFTHYLMEGLKGANGKSVDKDGMVTPESLINYIDSEIDNLPPEKRPQQTPVRKIEVAGKIVLSDPKMSPSIPTQVPIQVSVSVQNLLKLLQEEKIKEFNKLRKEQPKIFEIVKNGNVKAVNPSMMDLREVDLSKKNLSEARLELINFNGANLSGANLSLTQLDGSDLSDANLEGAKLDGSDLRNVNLQNSNLKKVTAINSIFRDVNFRNANMDEVILTSSDLRNADLTEAHLSHASLDSIDGSGANFTDIIMPNGSFYNANLERSNFTSANITGVNFSWAKLTDAIFKSSTIANTNFSGARDVPVMD